MMIQLVMGLAGVDDTFEVVRNLKTGKLFILIDESESGEFKVINSAGDLLELSPALFDDEPVLLEGDEAKNKLSAIQIDRYKKVDAELTAWADRQVVARAADLQAKKVAASKPAAPRKASKKKVKKKVERKGPPETQSWAASKLTFYRHYIEPLRGKDRMQIDLGNKGIFQCTKDQFLSVFNDVVLDAKFIDEGMFSYDELPEKAISYISSAQENT